MPVGAAIGIGALTAGTSLVGAKVASNASKDAAKIQSTSADKALDLQKSIYDSQVARAQPYVDAGNSALAGLTASRATPFTDRVSAYENAGRAAGGLPPVGTLGSVAGIGSAQPPQARPMMPPQAPPQLGGGLIRVQAPTGEVAMLPPDQAQRAISMGATRMM